MKNIILATFLVSAASLAVGQTMFIDYTERTGDNTAAIHIMEAKQTIESEEFKDIIQAKTKLIRIIENYRTAGYEVKGTSVSTHEHTTSFHYHYQYILQQPPIFDGDAPVIEDMGGIPMERKMDEKVKGSSGVSTGGDERLQPVKSDGKTSTLKRVNE